MSSKQNITLLIITAIAAPLYIALIWHKISEQRWTELWTFVGLVIVLSLLFPVFFWAVKKYRLDRLIVTLTCIAGTAVMASLPLVFIGNALGIRAFEAVLMMAGVAVAALFGLVLMWDESIFNDKNLRRALRYRPRGDSKGMERVSRYLLLACVAGLGVAVFMVVLAVLKPEVLDTRVRVTIERSSIPATKTVPKMKDQEAEPALSSGDTVEEIEADFELLELDDLESELESLEEEVSGL